MPVRATLTIPETLSDFILAPEERALEGLELIVATRFDAGGYLLGYVAEMLMKTACFLFLGAVATDTIDSHKNATSNYYKTRWGPNQSVWPVHPKGWHNVRFWHDYLDRIRRDALQPLDTTLATELGACVTRIDDGWDVSMRYRPPPLLTYGEARDLYEDVTWIQRRHKELYQRT